LTHEPANGGARPAVTIVLGLELLAAVGTGHRDSDMIGDLQAAPERAAITLLP
jgi:hypothetical protein